jgi:hypothetical protein
MRLLALIALLGSFIASIVAGQTLTEHAAAAAGATVGTAAGKPLGTGLGKIFGAVDNSASKSTAPVAAKPVTVKPSALAPVAPVTPSASTEHVTSTGAPSVGGGDGGGSGAGGGGGSSSHHAARRREVAKTDEAVPAPVVPVVPLAPVVVAEPVIKEPTVEEVASIQVGATASQLRAALGAPESTVSIPGDDGHLLEICQYWAKGEAIGTIRLDNGRVISVKTRE